MAVPKTLREWVARVLVGIVFAVNLSCAIPFFLTPGSFVDAYQLAGEGAAAAIAGMGVAFAMWNVTYLPVLFDPGRFRVVFGVVIAQQVVGLAGEIAIWRSLDAAQAVLAASIMRFVIFDAIGLVLLVIGFVLSRKGIL